MLPPTRQRIVIIAATAVSVVVWMMVRGWLRPGDLSSGITLGSAAAGVFGAMAAVLAAGAVSTLAGAVPTAAGHPLSGVFVVAMGLCVLAGWSGPIDGWMIRASLPRGYAWLVVEMLVWTAGWAAVVLVLWKVRPRVRAALPGVVVDSRYETAEIPDRPDLQAGLALTTATAVGAVVCWVLQRNTSEGQVIGTLIASFTLAGLAGQSAFPANRHVLAIVLSPAVVAIGAYLWAWLIVAHGMGGASGGGEAQVFAAWFNLNGSDPRAASMPGPALVLPIYYASAGVMGATMGVGLAQAIHATRQEANPAETAASA